MEFSSPSAAASFEEKLPELVARPEARSPSDNRPRVESPVGLCCPKCGQGQIIEGHRGFGCNRYREGCDFVVLRELTGKALTARQIAELIRTGRTRLLKGFRDREGRSFAARPILDSDFRVVLRERTSDLPD